LVVIKSTEGNVFGGFTSCPWNSISSISNSVGGTTYGYVSDASAFIFSLVNKSNKPFKTVYGIGQGVYCDKDLEGTKEAKAILAGSYNFQNVEIEVFTHSD